MSADIKQRLLQTAQRYIQTRGFHGFSFRDLGDDVGITTASIHYHFATKADLVVAVVRAYCDGLSDALADIAADHAPLPARLQDVTALFEANLRDGGRTCLCAALSGEFQGLPPEVQAEVVRLIDAGIRGIERILASAVPAGDLPQGTDTASLARLWFCTLQGGISLARASDPTLLATASSTLLAATTRHPPTAVTNA